MILKGRGNQNNVLNVQKNLSILKETAIIYQSIQQILLLPIKFVKIIILICL